MAFNRVSWIPNQSSHFDQSQQTETTQWTNQWLEASTCSWCQARENESLLFSVLLLIGWKSGTIFFNQSQSVECKTKANANYFQHSIENHSMLAFVVFNVTLTLIFIFRFSAQCDRPCLNGGFCVSRNNCRCQPGYHGDVCERGTVSWNNIIRKPIRAR